MRDEGATQVQLEVGQSTLIDLTSIMGLTLQKNQQVYPADGFINLLVELRTEMRNQKLWALSDRVRNRLEEMGVIIEDSKAGSSWHWQ